MSWVEIKTHWCVKAVFCDCEAEGRIQSHSLELTIGIPKIPEKVKKTIGWGPKDKCGRVIWNSALQWRDWCQVVWPVVVPICCKGSASYQKGQPRLDVSYVVYHCSLNEICSKNSILDGPRTSILSILHPLTCCHIPGTNRWSPFCKNLFSLLSSSPQLPPEYVQRMLAATSFSLSKSVPSYCFLQPLLFLFLVWVSRSLSSLLSVSWNHQIIFDSALTHHVQSVDNTSIFSSSFIYFFFTTGHSASICWMVPSPLSPEFSSKTLSQLVSPPVNFWWLLGFQKHLFLSMHPFMAFHNPASVHLSNHLSRLLSTPAFVSTNLPLLHLLEFTRSSCLPPHAPSLTYLLFLTAQLRTSPWNIFWFLSFTNNT